MTLIQATLSSTHDGSRLWIQQALCHLLHLHLTLALSKALRHFSLEAAVSDD